MEFAFTMRLAMSSKRPTSTPAVLSFAILFRREQDDARKLEHGAQKLYDNPGEKRPERIEDRDVVELEKSSAERYEEEQIKGERAGLRTF